MGNAAIGQRQEQSHRSGEALEATKAADDTDVGVLEARAGDETAVVVSKGRAVTTS